MFAKYLLLSLPFFGVASADSHTHVNRHRAIARRAPGDIQLHKRFSGSKWSFYDAGLGACGKVNSGSDFIVALNAAQFGSGYPGPNCFKQITMTYNGKTATATIMDKCPSCPYGGLDLTRSLFNFFDSPDKGIIFGSWTFGGGGGGGGGGDDDQDEPPPPPPKSTRKPKPTSDKKATPRPTPTPRTSSKEDNERRTTSTRRFSSSSSRTQSSSSASPAPSATVAPQPALVGTLADLNQAVVNIAGLMVADL